MTDPVATIQLGDCREIIAELPDCSIDSIVTDPPYELGFMGKAWDGSGIAYDVELWRQCLRVLKPGGHLLAFGGTRTYHRMTVAIEDAGFEIRDSIHWLYGSGFPKSLDVSKAIDKRGGVMPWQADFARHLRAVKPVDVTAAQINAHVANGTKSNLWGHFIDTTSQPLLPTVEHYRRLREIVPIDPEWDALFLPEAEREVVGTKTSGIANKDEGPRHTIGASQAVTVDITAPATDAARQWEGWGTALKPAHEPIVVARKPLTGTVAATVLEHGTGALNIDGCRIATEDTLGRASGGWLSGGYVGGQSPKWNSLGTTVEGGRWPANLVLTHAVECADECATGCPVAELDRQSGIGRDGVAVNRNRKPGTMNSWMGTRSAPVGPDVTYGGEGGASRFFTVTEWDPIADTVPFRYVAKPSRAERDAGLTELPKQLGGSLSGEETRPDRPTNHPMVRNHHPTVKPIALMRWLVRLVTPPDGTVLEPFAGSGTTMAAAILEDRHVIGCELTADYLPIIKGRIDWAHQERAATPPTLFDQTHNND